MNTRTTSIVIAHMGLLYRRIFKIPVVVLLVLATNGQEVRAQCDAITPVLTADLSASPSAFWQSAVIPRQGYCCGNGAPDRCIQFIITLHPDAQGIVFDVCEGAVPSGSMFYQIGCGPPTAVGTPACLNGTGPHVLTFCKPGNNDNGYCITSIPPPTAGPAIAVNDGCSGVITSAGFAPGTLLWNSLAPGSTGQYDGSLVCPTCASTVVTGQTGFPDFVDYQVCGNAVSPCSSVMYCDTVRVWFNSTLGATIVPTQPTVCFGAPGTTITAVGSGGTPPYSYLWNTGETTPSIFTGPGSYTVQLSDTSQCPPTTASVVVTGFSQPIEALAGTDIVVCNMTTSVTLNAQVTGTTGGQWITGGGNFSPNDTTLGVAYTATPAEVVAGFVDLVLATTGNGTCPGDLDTIKVHFDPGLLNATASATDASCAGGSDGSASAFPVDPALNYLWNDPNAQSTSTATGLAVGSYTVTITTALGCTIDVSVTVDAPQALAIASVTTLQESCAGMLDGSAMVTVSGGTQPYTYLWSTGAGTATITAGAGTYTVTMTDANNCAPAQGSATIGVTGLPNGANAGPEVIGCLDQLPIAMQGNVTNASSGVWSGGAGNFLGSGLAPQYMPSAAEIQAGSVTLVLTTTGNNSCPPASDQVTVLLSNAFLNATLNATPAACSGGVSGSAAYTPVLMGLNYAWDAQLQSINGPNASGLSAGNYGLTITDLLGCTMQLQTTVTEPSPLQAVPGALSPVTCAGGSNGSAAVSVTGGTAPYDITWSPTGQSGPTATALSAGAHTAWVVDANGCTASEAFMISAPSPITLLPNVPDTVCVNSNTALTASATGGAGGHTITWVGLGTGDTLVHNFTANQVVSLTVQDSVGCTGPLLSFPVTVLNLNLANLTAWGDTAVCPGGVATIGASLQGYSGPYLLSWPQLGNPGPGPFNVPVTTSFTLQVVATNTCGQTLTDDIQLVLESPPTVVLPALLGEGCAPFTITFPSLGLAPPLQYTWQLGNGQSSAQATPTITYPAGQYSVTLTVTTPAGCTSSAAAPGLVVSHTPPIADLSASPWSTDIDHAQVEFDGSPDANMSFWSWDFGDGATSSAVNPTHTFTGIGTFDVILTVIDANGCSDSVSHPVVITPIYDITIPNIFSPTDNSGGVWVPGALDNDIFYPFARFVKDFRMHIFNRWGELIFESGELARGWDGWYRGQLSAQDVYVYQMWVRFVDDKVVHRMGDLTLMR